MIPLRLVLKGIYSYRDRQVIDFTRLTAAHLFGIFGAVGSGKSTILEAITYALFGQTERLNSRGDNSTYNMMNLKSDELLIEFNFRTSRNDEEEFMVAVRGKRNSKKFDDVKSFERKAYKKIGQEWVPVELQYIENAIGLSYDNFKRTVIIPQGRFQEFLQLGNKDRTVMMKELFSLEKYDLFYKVAALESKNNDRIQNIEGQLISIGEVSAQSVEQREKDLQEIQQKISRCSESLEALRQENTLYEQLRERSERKSQLESEYTSLKDNEEYYLQLEKKLTEYEACFVAFKSHLDQLERAEENHLKLTAQIEGDRKSVLEMETELEKLQLSLDEVTPQYECRDELKHRIAELQSVRRMRELESSLNELSTRISKGEGLIKQTEGEIAGLEDSLAQNQKQIKELKSGLPDMQQLLGAQKWHSRYCSLKERRESSEGDVSAVIEEMASVAKMKAEVLVSAGIKPELEISPAKELLNERRSEAAASLESTELHISHLNVQKRLEEFAQDLQDGQPCPLCGALAHPEVLDLRNVNDELQEGEKKKKLLRDEILQLDRVIVRLDEIHKGQLKAEEEYKKRLVRRDELQNELQMLIQQYSWDERFRDEAELNRAFEDSKQITDQIEKAAQLSEQIGELVKRNHKNRDRYKDALEKLCSEKVSGETEIRTLLSRIRLLSSQEAASLTPEEISGAVERLNKEYEDVVAVYTRVSAELKRLRTSADTVNGRLQKESEALASEEETISELREKIQKALTETGFSRIETVKEILSEKINISESRQKVQDYYRELQLKEKLLEEITKEIGSSVYDPLKHEGLTVEIKQLDETLSALNNEQGAAESELRSLKASIKKQKSLRKELDSLYVREENLKTLKGLFKASGFVNFISTVFLKNLCNAANDRFHKMTRQTLRLEMTEDNNFQVRDYLNGGKTRNVKTLSGGQTFQAALSLALALSDNIQKLSRSGQNFFFLDEGFGSLDRESLSVVFETLKSLRKENRIVGVISHVEEMQQEIDTHLKIVNDPESGSRIIPSWE